MQQAHDGGPALLAPATRSPVLDRGDPDAKRAEILATFRATWELYERLFEVLAADEAFYRRADPLRHPLIFYYGHTATFFVNKLILAKVVEERIDPRLESMFAIGVDEMSWDDLDETHYDWPTVAEVKRYRDRARALVEDVIGRLPLRIPITWDEPFWVVLMGIEHERIHLETSSVLIRQLPLDLVRPHPAWPACAETGPAPENDLLRVPGGKVVLGKSKDHPLYGWDNEFGRHEEEVPIFHASRYLVSNDEFRAFVEDGGYREERWWTKEGWAWGGYRRPEHPLFWVPGDDGAWRLRLLAEEIPLPGSWPVEVNYLEAKAFCAWKGARSGKTLRLPTEEEWYRLLDVAGLGEVEDWADAPGNIHLRHWASSCPVDRFVTGGFGDVVGNVWQWTETPIAGFEGFEVHPLYDDFSTPTFDARHNLMKGGSWISTGNEATRRSRYAFRRHFFQHAGFRLVESSHPVRIREDVYETDELVAQYCEFHYGDDHLGVPSFPAALARLCAEVTEDRPRREALDLGCATGRATFELARSFEHVLGVDFSARFVKIALEMKERGSIRYVLPEEGELVSYHERRLADLGLDETRARVDFVQGDAHNLKEQLTGYDLVLAANLIDRLYDPGRFLRVIAARIRPGGILVIASPYTWLEEFTARDKWLGGLKRDGENVTSLDGLHAALEPRFRRLGEPREVPFVIRETRRKHQHTISEVTVWERVE